MKKFPASPWIAGWALALAASSGSVSAEVNCVGKINDVYKWNSMTAISVRLVLSDGRFSNWISLPTKSDEAMALVAFTSNKPVLIYWSAADITSCVDGWIHNRLLTGYFLVTQ